jgi:hypothetical protein
LPEVPGGSGHSCGHSNTLQAMCQFAVEQRRCADDINRWLAAKLPLPTVS